MAALRRGSVGLTAELTIVVLGVLLALWAEGRVSQWRERGDLMAQLEVVRDELARAQALLDVHLRSLEEESAALRRLASLDQGGITPPDDSLGYFVTTALLIVQEYRPNIPAFRELQASGRVPTIQRVELRRALSSLHEALLRTELLSSVSQTGPQQSIFDPFVLENFPSVVEWVAQSDDPEFPALPHDPADWELLKSREARSLLAFRSSANSMAEGEWRSLSERIAATIAQIDLELGS